MTIELEIVKNVPPGDGFGYHNGKAVFVPAASVGDVVLVEPVKEKKRFIIAALKKVLTPSKDRIDAECPHYELCGGCSLMHLPMEKQLALKQQMLLEVLANNQIEAVPAIVPSPEAFQFRHRTQFTCKDGVVGYSARSSNQIVEIQQCSILSPGNQALISQLKQLGRIHCEFELLESAARQTVTVSVREKQKSEPLAGYPPTITEDYGYGPITLTSSSFSQSNPFVTRLIITDLLKEVNSQNDICELYCGSGTFSIPLAATVNTLIGYDFSASAIAAAENNASLNGLDNATFKRLNLEKNNKISKTECVVLDPPRKGLSPNIIRMIGRSSARKLIYVSCNPATFARDAKELIQSHGFQLSQLKGYDMYCHSTHLELMAVLSR